MDLSQIETFIAQAEPDKNSNRFVIGGFEGGITVYKQQVRALNLIYSLYLTERIKKGDKLAIIGGGISGVTAAAAAMALSCTVYLFERRPMLLHLQHGCDIRWLHPHIYDWPAHGARIPYAGLPLLDWREGTAASVVEQMLRAFEQIRKKPKAGKFHEHTGATIALPEPLRVAWSGSFGAPKSSELDFKAIIFAVGFGVEREVDSESTTSYWRNDSVNQPKPGASAREKTKYLISGTGDGGLIDLLRARLQSFNQGQIIEELVGVKDEKLLSELRTIAEQWGKADHPETDTWLYDAYARLYEAGTLKPVERKVLTRLRKDTSATLNGKAERLSHALRLDQASLFNTLITYILAANEEFEYLCGELKRGENNAATINDRKVEANHIIIRHGTNREAVFQAVGFTEGVRVLKANDMLRRRIDTSHSLWPAGWWGENSKDVLSGVREEFVSPTTQTIATTFVSTLSDIIGLYKSSKRAKFRITLHRLINVNGEDLFQQVSPYAGTRTSGKVGRVFDVNGGLVGLVCRMAQPVVVVREDDFDQVWKYLHFESLEARAIDPSVQSLLACPFFAQLGDAKLKGGAKPKYISMVLFMDSEQKDFFTRQVLKVVYGACRGFVQNLEKALRSEDSVVTFASSDYPGYPHTKNKRTGESTTVKKFKSVKTDNEEFKNFIEDLTFKTVSYFDAYLKR